MKMKKIFSLMLLCATVLFSSCSSDDDSNEEPKITINKTSVTLKIGDKEKLTATIVPEGTANKSVTWSSDKTDIATVNATTGEVTAIANGTAIITATSAADNSLKATCTVTVASPIGNYFYKDGSSSPTFTNNPANPCLGIVFWQDPENPEKGKIVSLDEPTKTYKDAVAWAAAKTDGGKTWTLPKIEDMQLIYCAYIGVAPKHGEWA